MLAAVFGVIMYRIIIVTLFYASQETFVQNNAKLATTATAACLSLVVIIILNRVHASYQDLSQSLSWSIANIYVVIYGLSNGDLGFDLE